MEVVDAQFVLYDALRFVRAVFSDREQFERELEKMKWRDVVAIRYRRGVEEGYIFPTLRFALIYRPKKEAENYVQVL